MSEDNAADFTARRGEGLYENEISNVFHLATLPDRLPSRKVVETIRDAERDRIAERIEAMLDQVITDSGYRAGWNAALEAVYKEIFSYAPLTGYHRNSNADVGLGPVLSKPNWHKDWAYSERRDWTNDPQRGGERPVITVEQRKRPRRAKAR
jgi:hypothetical protein